MARKKLEDLSPIEDEKIVEFYPDPAGFGNPEVHVSDDNIERSVPDVGHVEETKRKASPEEAEAVNKAKLARGDTDLVEAEPDEIPPAPEGSQPGPADFDPNIVHKTVDDNAL